MLTINTVLVPTDFSESSAGALEYGRALCRRFGSALVLMHVVETQGFTNVVASSGYAAVIPDLFEEIVAGERARLDALVTDEDRQVFRVETVSRVTGRPAREIVHYAAEAKVDLIVMGTHGRKGLSHLVLGSIAEEVVRTAGCPVLTVRPSGSGIAGLDASNQTTIVASPA